MFWVSKRFRWKLLLLLVLLRYGVTRRVCGFAISTDMAFGKVCSFGFVNSVGYAWGAGECAVELWCVFAAHVGDPSTDLTRRFRMSDLRGCTIVEA